MNRTLFDHIDIDPSKTYVPECFDDNFDSACSSYENEINKRGGIGLQLLGVGSNGHIGFNEPTSSFQSRTRVKTLTKSTLTQNARFFLKPLKINRLWPSPWELEPLWKPKIFF